MLLLRDMRSEGLVYAACGYRNSIMQLDSMMLGDSGAQTISVTAMRVIRRFLVPMAHEIERYFSMFGLCPYAIVRERIFVGDDPAYQRKFPGKRIDYAMVAVPRVIEVGAFHIKSYLDATGVKTVEVTNLRGEPIKTVVFSRTRQGPRVNSIYFDTECGAVLEEYILFKRKRRLLIAAMQRDFDAPIWVRKDTSRPTYANDMEMRRFEEYTNVVMDGYGYIHPATGVQEVDGLAILPNEYTTAPFQPRSNLRINEEQLVKQFAEVVASAFMVPLKELAQSGTGMINHRSESAVDEDRSKMSAGILLLLSDVSSAVQEIWQTLYKTAEVPIHFQMRPLIDIDRLQLIFNEGIIGDDVYRQEALKVMGIHPSRGTSGPLVRRVGSSPLSNPPHRPADGGFDVDVAAHAMASQSKRQRSLSDSESDASSLSDEEESASDSPANEAGGTDEAPLLGEEILAHAKRSSNRRRKRQPRRAIALW